MTIYKNFITSPRIKFISVLMGGIFISNMCEGSLIERLQKKGEEQQRTHEKEKEKNRDLKKGNDDLNDENDDLINEINFLKRERAMFEHQQDELNADCNEKIVKLQNKINEPIAVKLIDLIDTICDAKKNVDIGKSILSKVDGTNALANQYKRTGTLKLEMFKDVGEGELLDGFDEALLFIGREIKAVDFPKELVIGGGTTGVKEVKINLDVNNLGEYVDKSKKALENIIELFVASKYGSDREDSVYNFVKEGVNGEYEDVDLDKAILGVNRVKKYYSKNKYIHFAR